MLYANFLLGLGQSIAFTPMTVMAFSTLQPARVTEASRMTEFITHYNKSLSMPGLPPQWSLESLARLQNLSNEILRQAATIGYLNSFHLMAFVALGAMPFAAFMRRVR